MKRRLGFTLIELAIVMTVIAILATITTLSYSAVRANSRDSQRETKIQLIANELEKYYEKNGEYPSCSAITAEAVTVKSNTLPSIEIDTLRMPNAEDGATNSIICDELANISASIDAVAYVGDFGEACQTGNACNSWTLEVRKESGEIYKVESRRTVDVIAMPPTTMQTLTKSFCGKLKVYTGTNGSVIINLTDNRGSTTRNYKVAKLADGNCWMLNDLKLGDTKTITLTPSDSDVSSNFSLPAMKTSGTSSYTAARVYGPVPGDTGSGATNYGYLYNWTAATAGETTSTMPDGSGNAPHSICPKGWSLPTGAEYFEATEPNDFRNLDIALGGSGDYQLTGTSITKWYGEPFKGSRSGQWTNKFSGQGTSNMLWSSTSDLYMPDYSSSVSSSNGHIYPGNYSLNPRAHGLAMRCVFYSS